MIQICTDNGWDYIIRYKEGCAPSIAREYQALHEKEKIGSEIEYQNEIIFQNTDVNLILAKKVRLAKRKIQIYTHFFRRGISVIIQCG